MYMSKHKSGVYYIYFNSDGRRRKISTKARIKSDALKFLSTFRQELERRNQPKATPITIQRFSFEFRRQFEPGHSDKSMADYVTTFRQLEKHFGNVELTTLNKNTIGEYLARRIQHTSVYAARKDFINLSASFNWAVRNGYLLANPCSGVAKPRIPEKLPNFFTEAEFEKLLNSIHNQDMKDLVAFAVNTGLRQMELLTLEWRQVNLNSRMIVLDNHGHITKGKKIRSVPLNEEAMSVLMSRKIKSPGDIVFTFDGQIGEQHLVSQKFKRCVKRAKINPKLNFHSLRHTFASWLVQRGVSIYQVSRLLGHSSVNITAIYSHLQPDDLRESVEKLLVRSLSQ